MITIMHSLWNSWNIIPHSLLCQILMVHNVSKRIKSRTVCQKRNCLPITAYAKKNITANSPEWYTSFGFMLRFLRKCVWSFECVLHAPYEHVACWTWGLMGAGMARVSLTKNITQRLLPTAVLFLWSSAMPHSALRDLMWRKHVPLDCRSMFVWISTWQ